MFYLKLILIGICLLSEAKAQLPKKIKYITETNRNTVLQHFRTANCNVDTILITTQIQIDNFATTYPTCTAPKYLIINGANATPAITNLTGLSSITAVVNKLEIRNTNVTSLAALNNIDFIGDTLLLERNNLLTNIGLTNLDTLGAIYFSHLPMLNSVAGLCNNMHKTGLIYIDSTNLSNLNGLNTIDSLTTPNGGLSISYSPILNLSVVNNLKYMLGYLRLSNNVLQTSVGLNNLQYYNGFLFDGLPLLNSVSGLTSSIINGNIGTFWIVNTGIASLVGLEGLTGSANFYIDGNNNLTSLNGLQNLNGNIPGGISIYSNSALTDISALQNITTVEDGTVEISYTNITNLNGLKSLTGIGKGLWIIGNNNLTNLDSLHPNLNILNNEDPYSLTKDSVRIINNANLALCAAPAICNYVSSGMPAEINNNALGCNSTSEIVNSCIIVPIFNEIEDNCCILNANVLQENTEILGRVGQYDPIADIYLDEYDTYRIIVRKAGDISVSITAKRDSCNTNSINIFLVDKQGYNFGTFHTINFVSFPCDSSLVKTFEFNALENDTFYLQLHANNQVGYKIKYNLIDSAKNDIEPNNTFAESILIAPNEVKNGHTLFKRFANGINDYQDNYKAYIPNGGKISVFLKTKNKDIFPRIYPEPYYYSLKINNVVVNGIYPPNTYFINNIERTDTLNFCGIEGDTLYFTLSGFATFEYEFSYEVVSTPLPLGDVEPNNTKETATILNYNQVANGRIKTSKLNVLDNEDYYKITIPYAGKMKLIVTPNYIGCNSTSSFSVNVYNSNISSLANIVPSYVADDTLFYCGMFADVAYIKISATDVFTYTIRYEITDTFTNDIEPNDFVNAIPISKNETKKGTIRMLNSNGTDYDDYYRIITTCADTIKLKYQFKNIACNTLNDYYQIKLLNKNGVDLYTTQLSNIANGNIGVDSFAFAVNSADTFYVNLYGGYASSYDLSLKNTAPSPTFTITGSDSACIGSKIYKAENICGTGLTYNWGLSSGGTITNVDSIATVNWTTPGTHTISLYVSNIYGNSATKNYIINVITPLPPTAPVITANARILKSTIAPSGVGYQWYKTGVVIVGANDSTYFAADSGTYIVRYKNYCGTSNASNAIFIALPLLNQTIVFNPPTPDIIYASNTWAIAKATASSSLPIIYSIISGPAIISLDSVIATGAGTVIIAANQVGNLNFNIAPTKYDTIQVLQGSQTIIFNLIPNKKYSDTTFTLNASSSVGLPITYTVTSGNATLSGNMVTLTGSGNATIQATQNGNTNYTAALPASQSFCIGVKELSAIQGETQPCLGTYKYTTKKINNANYFWTLSSGGSIVFNNDTATIIWTTTGTHTITVKANSNCDADYSTIHVLTISTSNNVPTMVNNMLPINNIINQQLPLSLSWLPGLFTVNYDLYIWRSDTLQPALPFASHIIGTAYTIPQNSLAFNKTYKWRLVSKNPCNQTAGTIQQFTTIPLPDLEVIAVQAPITAFSGQNIAINWTIKNIGPGKTTTNQGWNDAVFLSFDSAAAFALSPTLGANGWDVNSIPSRPLLIGTKPNLTALDSGQQYTNTLNYNLPIGLSGQVYAYVVTNYNKNLLEVTQLNDTAQALQPIAITLSPTPDLRVDSVFAPNTTFSGSTINVTYKVKNYGANTPVGSIWYEQFFISNSSIFNINNAIELKLAKPNGTYYYNNLFSYLIQSAIIQTDSFYTKMQQLVIPNFIHGTYFIHVKTNATNTLYEGSATTNNTNYKQIQIIITPTPKLEIVGLNLSGSTFSSSQPFNVNYNIINNGFFDNIEKNQGHHVTIDRCDNCGLYGKTYSVALASSSANNNAIPPCYLQYYSTDSIGWGSSQWNDNIYISTDSTNLNSGNAILINTKLHTDPSKEAVAGFDLVFNRICGLFYPNVASANIFNVIRPTKHFPTVANATIPNNLPSGNYYVYVWANANKGVFEFPANNEIKRTGMITIGNPDLTVSNVVAPSSIFAGQSFAINYTIANNNSNGVFNALRKDKVYISNSPVYDHTALLINAPVYTENVLQNAAVTHSINYSFPFTTSGTKYIFIRTNTDSSLLETSFANNINMTAFAINVIVPPASATNDLEVSTITLLDTVFTKLPIQIQYTVANNGLGTAQGIWIDSFFVSCSPIYNSATAKFVAARQQNRTVAGGTSYTDAFSFITDFANLANPCFPNQQYNNAYFFVKTNANNTVYEGANTGNNISNSGLKIIINPWPDYIVTQVNSSLDTITVGRPFPVSWTLKNLKYDYMANYFSDAIYFSPDSVFNNNAVRSINEKGQYRSIAQNQTYSDNFSFTTPNISTGNYYAFVKTNITNNIYNEDLTNNTNLIRHTNGTAKKIHVIKLPLPDFVDSIIEAPTTIAIGQPLKIKTAITNNGLGANYPSNFSNRLWLNTNFSTGGYEIGSNNASILLNAGQSYTDSITLIVPLYIPAGNYILVWHTNPYNNIFETNSTNNLAFRYITVVHPTPVDLLVDNINIPDTTYLGYSIDTLKWTILNNATNSAAGISSDGLYLSKSNILDSTATLLAITQRVLQMAPLQKDTLTKLAIVNNVAEGNYNVLIKTDVLNNIIETNKNNNVSAANKQLYVKVKDLPLNILTPTTLNNQVYRYFKLKIPDSLRGSTIQVTLKSNDSLIRNNQMFISAGYVPNPAHFDYKFETPNYGNQNIVITSVNDSVYYITLRNVNADALQNITLKAVKLPFTILNIQSNSGGNTGNVTVKISGNLFTNTMVATLKLGAASITASTIYFVNSTTVFATFNLAAKPLGIYDVTLFKSTDSTHAVLANGFSIVAANNGGLITGSGINGIPGNGNQPGCYPNAASGLNSQLTTEIIAPEKIFIPFPYQIQLNFSNPTNIDVPAQNKILYTDNNVQMALTQAGLAMGTNSLYISFTEPGGPPGIIRAGASGSLIVYCKAPNNLPGHTFIHYILK